MKISHLSIRNYCGLHHVDIPVANFACIIGENNAGKSTLLRAFLRFLDGKTLNESEYYNPQEDVVILIEFAEITESDLLRLSEEHRERIQTIIYEGKLQLVRRFPHGGRSNLLCCKKIPVEERFRENYVRDSLRGSGLDSKQWLKDNYPELSEEKIQQVTSQTKAQEVVDEYIIALSDTDFTFSEAALPTGIANSIVPLLPEPIHIEAVKDFSDEVKTKQSTTFGKLLGLLLERIEPKLDTVQEAFAQLRVMFNIQDNGDGTREDNRLEEIREIENTVKGYLQETFAHSSVEFKIPPPELKTLLENATIAVNDGVEDLVETKGDGMRRSIIFALLRSYVELSNQQNAESNEENLANWRYLFLFEEPELYLHPKAQKTLFDALTQISHQHQVVISTHSPFFFEPDNTDVFVKMVKRQPDLECPKPYGHAMPIALSDMDLRDRFQLISFETSNTAFFSNIVVLVEGDTDVLVYRHIARTLNLDWSFQLGGTSLVNIGGKANIKRYKEFFSNFDVKVMIITDLDILLSDFNQLDSDESCRQLQSTIIQKVDQFGGCGEKKKRLEILKDHTQAEIVTLKRELFTKLRDDGVFVLEKGAIEAYYPEEIGKSGSKPQHAFQYRSLIRTRDDVIKWCYEIPCEGQQKPELEVIFSAIFG